MQLPLRGAIAGCGYFGRFQLEAWARMPDVRIVAAADPVLERARAFAPAAYSSAAEMLERERPDFLDIATRPDTHLELVSLAAAHRLPVICQKPMARDWAEAVRMVEVAEAAGIPLMIHENWRWQPWYREAARRIARGDIGRPIGYWFHVRQRDGLGPTPYPRQPYFVQMPRLLIYETLVHQIDTARFLFGDIARIYAEIRRINPVIAGEDQAAILLRHVSDLPGLIESHRFADPVPKGPAMGDACFDGEEGSLLVRATGEIFAGEERVWTPPPEQGYRGDSVFATQRHFIDCLLEGRPFETSGREYLKTFAAVEAAYDSAARGAAVSLSPWP